MAEARTRRPALAGRPGTIVVRRADYRAGEELDSNEESSEVAVPFFGEVEVGRVRVGGGVTRNMGDFNSVRLDVAVELPCLPVAEEVERAYGIASRMVEGYLRREMDQALAGRKDGQEQAREQPRRAAPVVERGAERAVEPAPASSYAGPRRKVKL